MTDVAVHSPMAPLREHQFVEEAEYLMQACAVCGRLRPVPGTKWLRAQYAGVEPVLLKHNTSPRGCRACRRQFRHTMPDDLALALVDATFEVGLHHGQLGLPEWTQASVGWYAGHFHLLAYQAGYRAGELAREGAA
jgi:hypothetical protein